MWEEPCISGREGSGAIFFTGCGLGCVYCQNAEISGGQSGKPITIERLADIMLELQDKGANNINLVTAAQYIPQVAQALKVAKAQGLRIPVVYNSSGYEKVISLRLLEGLVDVWLPDFKYMDPELAAAYSHAPDYPEIAKRAIAEMVRQAGEPEFYEETRWGTDGEPMPAGSGAKLMKKGVIVRHLLLPGHVKNAKAVVQYLHETYGNSIYISMMNQYTPMGNNCKDPLLARKVTKREYERLTEYAVGIGVEYGFIQEGETAKESFIPSWNGEGV
jgi:putative pyruvate formate lyase activating enzyme